MEGMEKARIALAVLAPDLRVQQQATGDGSRACGLLHAGAGLPAMFVRFVEVLRAELQNNFFQCRLYGFVKDENAGRQPPPAPCLSRMLAYAGVCWRMLRC